MQRSKSLRNVNRCQDRSNELNVEVAALKRENESMKFVNSQMKTQMRKLQLENVAKNRRLRELQDCAACDCLQTRRRGFSGNKNQKQIAQVKDIDVEKYKPISDIEIHSNRNNVLKIAKKREEQLLNEITTLRSRLRNLERHSGEITEPEKFQSSGESSHGGFADFSSLQAQIVQLQKKNQQLSTRNRQITNQMMKEKNLFDESTTSLKGIISELNKRNLDFEKCVDDAKSENSRLLIEIHKLRSSLKAKAATFDEGKQRTAQLENLNRQLESQLAQSKGREKDLLVEMEYYKTVEAADDLMPKIGFDEGQRKFRDYNPFCPVCKALKRPTKSGKAVTLAANERNQNMVSGEDSEEIDRLRNELEIYKTDLETLKNRQSAVELSDENRFLKEKIQIMEQNLTKLRNQNDHLAAKLESGINAKVTEPVEYQKAVADLKFELQESETIRHNLETKLKDSTRAMSDMNLVIQRYQRDLAEAHAENLRLQAKLDRQSELEKILQERNFEIERLRNAIATIEIEYGRFRRGLSEQEVIMLGLQKDLEVANSLRKEVEKSKQVMLETNQRLRNEVQLLSAERDVLRNELNHLNAEFSTTKHRLQEYVGEVQDMERVLSQKSAERTMIISNEFHSNVKDEEINRLRAENAMLLGQKSVLDTKIDDVQQLLTQIQAAIDQSNTEREQLITDKRTLAAELDDKMVKLVHAGAKIATLNAQLDQLKSQVSTR